MSRALVQFNDYISITIMFLMLFALLGGRAAGSEMQSQARFGLAASLPFSAELEGHLGHQAVKAGIAVIAAIDGSSHFRGEDE